MLKEIPSLEIEEEEKEENKLEEKINIIPEEFNEKAFVQSNIYDIFLEDNGLPKLKKGEIFIIDNETEVNIKLNNNSKISNEVNLISNYLNEFQMFFFLKN
jgi:hypothetical protein